MSYVFYDTETTGTETAFDQILQFAAIKTDEDFNELDRFDIRCRLLPHMVPSPGALRVTRVEPDLLSDPALPSHYEMIQEIKEKLEEWSPATFIGFNSIEFDEELLRQAFFQNLFPAYLTNTGGNSRADAMRLAHATSIYAPEAISVPIDQRGRPTFRLELLAPANGYNHDQAHEALADVEATIYITRLIRDRAPHIWQAMASATNKNAVRDFVSSQPLFSLTERYFGRTYSWLVCYCGSNPTYAGQLAVFDLYFDPQEYVHLSAEDLVHVMNASPKAIRSLSTNKQPIMMDMGAAPENTKALELSTEELHARAAAIRNDPDFHERVGEALTLRFADQEPSPFIEKRIYDGFPSNSDHALMRQFHSAPWAARPGIVAEIEDGRVQEFAYRLIYFEHPEVLDEEIRNQFQAWHIGRTTTEDNDVPWMTLPKAISDVDGLLANASDADAGLLGRVREYILRREY